MRINVYSQELILGGELLDLEVGTKESNTGVSYSYVRQYLHSSDRLHHPPRDDDRSAITWWLPKSAKNREAMAAQFEELAGMIRCAPPETGLD